MTESNPNRKKIGFMLDLDFRKFLNTGLIDAKSVLFASKTLLTYPTWTIISEVFT